MKSLPWSRVATHLLTLAIGLGIGFFSWNTSSNETASQSPSITNVAPPGNPDEMSAKGAAKTVLPNPTITDSPEDSQPKEEVKEEPVEEPSTTTPPISRNKLKRTKMGISDKKIGEILTSIAENLEAKKLEYRSDLLQDCSGIFHQMKDSLQNRLPALGGAEYQYPSSKNVRNTRQIADWFYKNNNLLIVEDAVASKNSIRPGSVMFYGKSNKTFTNIDIDMLTDRKNNYTPNGAIMHIAVVTAVTTDKEGIVVDYTIMHGRNPRRHASRTGSKEIQSTRTKGLPPFGNWSQQLVAIANIATPKA